MKKCFQLWGALLLMLFIWGVLPAGSASCQSTPPPAPLTPYQIIDAVNQKRTSFGHSALNIDPILMGTAQTTADSMAASQIHGHIGGVKERVIAAGYGSGDIAFATENFVILRPDEGIGRLMEAWSDEVHMYPMTNVYYKHIGVGVAPAEEEGLVYFVLHAAYTSNGTYKPYQTPGPGTPTVEAVSQYIYAVQTVTPQADGSLIHTVKSGQSLWSIAIAYGTHIEVLQRLNGYASGNTTVYSGQKLVLPTNPDLPTQQASATPQPQESLIPITIEPTGEPVFLESPTHPGFTPQTGTPLPLPEPGKGANRTVAVVIIVVFLFGASMIATGSLWKKNQ